MPDLASMANSVAGQYGIPTNIFSSLIQQESGWNPNITGKAGEQGLTQLMPATAAGLGVTNAFDPLQNLQGGASYLSQMYKKFGNWTDALRAYNGGPGFQSSSAQAQQQTAAYAATVLQGAGLAGSSAPGVQASPTGVPGVNAPVPGGTATPAASGSKIWYYAVAIVIILILVAFGVWGTVKS